MINVNKHIKTPITKGKTDKKGKPEVITYPIEEPPSYILIEGATWNGKPTYEKVYILS